MTKPQKIDMCSGPLFGKICAFSLPLMLTGVLQLLYNAADMVIVGKYDGSTALAAVGSTSSLINLIVNLFVGLSVGASVVVAQCYGAHKEDEVSETVHTAMSVSLIAGVAVCVLGLFAARPMLEWMGNPDDVIDQSALYLKIYFLSMPAAMVYNYGSSILRGVGDTRRPLYYLLVSGALNVALNFIFVKYLGMGVAGVATATVISQVLAAVLVVSCLIRSQECIRLDIRAMRIKIKKLWQIMRIGLPAGLQGTVFSFSNVIIQSSINSFGSVAMAGSSAAASLEGFVYTCMNSVGQASLTFTGQNYGAGNYKRIKSVLVQCLLFVSGAGLLLGNLVYLFGPHLLYIYTDDPQVVESGMIRLSMICTLYFLCGVMDVFAGSMRGMGCSFLPMVVSLAGACGFRLVWIATIFRWESTLSSLYLSYPVSWTITSLVHLLCFAIVYSRVVRSAKLEQTEFAPQQETA